MRRAASRLGERVVLGMMRTLYRARFGSDDRRLLPLALAGERVMVIAPHPDDEIIGLGGILLQGGFSELTIVYCTDGECGDVTLEASEMASVRRSEAASVASLLSADAYYMSIPERRLREHIDESSLALRTVMQSVQPSVVCVPLFMDPHIDHVTANILVREAIRFLKPMPPRVISYAVRVPLVPGAMATHVCDTGRSLKTKLRILNEFYSSQAKVLNMHRYLLVDRIQGALVRSEAAEMTCVMATPAWTRLVDMALVTPWPDRRRYIPSMRDTVFSRRQPLRPFLTACTCQRAVVDEVLDGSVWGGQ